MGYMPQAEYRSSHRTITNPFDIKMDGILLGSLQAQYLSRQGFVLGHGMQNCSPQLLWLCPLLVGESLLSISRCYCYYSLVLASGLDKGLHRSTQSAASFLCKLL